MRDGSPGQAAFRDECSCGVMLIIDTRKKKPHTIARMANEARAIPLLLPLSRRADRAGRDPRVVEEAVSSLVSGMKDDAEHVVGVHFLRQLVTFPSSTRPVCL